MNQHSRWAWTLLVAPIVVTQGASWLSSPRHAAADQAFAEPAPLAPQDRQLSKPGAPDILAWERDELGALAFANPLARPVPSEAPSQDMAQAPQPSPEPDVAPAPELRLSGMTGRGSTGMAIINGRLRRIGEVIAPGYRLLSVDAASRTVTIEGPGAKAQTLTLSR